MLAGNAAAILHSAARRVALNWGPHAARSTDVAELSLVLAGTIAETQITGTAVIDDRVRSDVGRRLIARLRKEIITQWSGSGTPDSELPPLLLALERVHDALEPTPVEAFTEQVGGPDGMELLVDVAHDLRSPLTSILFLVETMQRGQSGPISDVQRRQLGLIYTTALGLSSVASDIIDLTRSEQLVEPAPIPFSLSSMLQSMDDIVRPMVEEKELSLRVLGPTVDQRLGHPVALSRVLLNLTTNALKFTEKGFVEIVTRELLPQRIEFAVRDSGRGMDRATVAALFNPLRVNTGQAPGTRGGRAFSRTGLGLTICRRLVAAMGSELQVDSRPGWGTRFYFELDMPPYASPRYTPARTTPPQGATGLRASDPKTPRPLDAGGLAASGGGR